MTTDQVLLAEPQRQSPIAVAFLALRAIRRIGIAQLVVAVLFLTRLPVAALFTVIPLIGLVLLGFSVLAWWRFTFVVADAELHVTKGVLSQERLTVPLERVQSVSIHQQLLHRLVGLVNVSVDTAGASTAEFEIDAIDRPIAEALQRVVADHATTTAATRTADEHAAAGTLPPPTIAPTERQILRHSARRLVTSGLTRPSFAGFAVLVPLLAFGDEVADLVGISPPNIDSPEPTLGMIWLLPVIAVLVTLAGFALNLLQTIVTEWNLTLTLRDRGFVRESGLISRRSTATTIDRVQRIEVRRNPLETRVGIQRVALPTIGPGDLSLPGTDAAELAELRRLVIDPDATVEYLDRAVSPLAVFLATRNATIFAVLLVAALFSPLGWWSLAALWIVPWTWWSSRRQQRRRRWGLGREGVAQHHEFITIHTEELMLRKVNGVAVKQGLFERKRGLATVHLQTADGGISIGMLPLGEAYAVRDRALMVAETNTKAWM